MARVWLITGCSSGFGRQIAIAAAKIGDTVVATSRDPSKLEDLKQTGNILPQRLDICASDEEVQARIAEIITAVGRIDVLVNNAGYILEGAIEESSAAEIEDLFGANVFGQLRLLRAVLPTMRAQRSGTIANMGSIGGWRGTPGAGLYCATKAAIAIYTEALRAELAPFGIETTCIEPGYFRTNFLESDGSHKVTAKNHISELDVVTQPTKSRLAAYSHHQPGDPVKGARLIVEALTRTGRCQGRTLPPRLALGRDAVQVIGAALDQSCEALDAWKELVSTTDCDDVRN
ncbi:hypothetical protein Asppvi_005392 [Aspergillus pseudoviridinutans]|uniref:Uncharacterized protein n=1 Tax=Aspergillus pseudoviridinutans TaxID=1517512 RepID=A0A9P3BC82_9EURO|nr:uncharacterized protein Asppvi_005392 [Aspergillus pseudoviridinutans]GIJ86503.1 hypothetical protein Asppvi_005392 [Aspergillus pseudoviridinutans]